MTDVHVVLQNTPIQTLGIEDMFLAMCRRILANSALAGLT